MLFNPIIMKELKKKKKTPSMKQKPIPTHREPSIYVATKVEKRKS